MSLKLYNTLTNKKEIFEPIEQGKVGMYVCGVTVYDNCHLGHARAYVAFDILVRYFRYQGYKVNYVRNITDIEDKIIERANENSESIYDLTSRTIASMHADFQGLGLIEPNSEPKATEYIDGMVTMIEDLIAKGHAYVADNNDVFFSVRSYEEYGKLSNKVLDDLDPGSRISEDQAKADPLDFVLWKSAKPEEPSWDSPWGKGRPGWHIECSVMSLEKLGKNFDIHGGGPDLIFPHHENEIAQSCVYNGTDKFANYWVHNGFVTTNKEKMSKSLGNIMSIEEATKKYTGQVVRLSLLSAQYKQPLDWNNKLLMEQSKTLDKWYSMYSSEIDEKTPDCFNDLLDDMNTPLYISKLHELFQQSQNGDKDKKKEFNKACRLIGLFNETAEKRAEYKKSKVKITEDNILSKIKDREEAKKAGNYKLADQIRDDLNEEGIDIKDEKGKTIWNYK